MQAYEIIGIDRPDRLNPHEHGGHIGNSAGNWRIALASALRRISNDKATARNKNTFVGLRALVAMVAVGASASPATASTPYEIATFEGNQCLQPVNGSTKRGAAIVQETCNGSVAQQWTEVSVGNNSFHYVNGLSGLCLDARGRPVNHTPIQQWTCNKISNENWQPGDDSDDTIPPLISRVSGTNSFCLDVPGAQFTAGLAVQIYRCNGTVAQDWWIGPSPSNPSARKEMKCKIIDSSRDCSPRQ